MAEKKSKDEMNAAATDHVLRAEELIAEAETLTSKPVDQSALATLAMAHLQFAATGLHVDAYIEGQAVPIVEHHLPVEDA